MAASKLELGKNLHAQVQQRPGGTWVALAGRIDESADLTPLTKLSGPVAIDLAHLDRINSVGVRDWIHFVRDSARRGIALTFERISPVMTGQITMIKDFMGGPRQLRSLHVPYACGSCHHEHFDVLEMQPRAQLRVSLPCPKCGAAMELDDHAETYQEVLRLSA